MNDARQSASERAPRSRRRLVVVGIVAVLLVAVVASTAISRGKWRVWAEPDDVPEGVEPVRVGPELTLAEGTVSGVNWRVTAFKETRGEFCMHFETVPYEAGGCGFAVPAERSLSYMSDALEPDMFSQLQRATQFGYGPVSKSVARVELTLRDGRTIRVTPIKVAGLPVNAFVATWKGAPGVESVIAYGPSGDALDQSSPP